MNKFVIPDIKKLKKKYRFRFLAILIPFVQFNVVIAFIIFLNNNYLGKDFPPELLNRVLFTGCSIMILYCLISYLICSHLVNAHKKNTFMEICSNTLVISQHRQTVIRRFRKDYYKNLYILPLTELNKISLSKGKIKVSGKIRAIYDKADRLHYQADEKKGIKFDVWWYDYNSSEELESIEIADVYHNSPRLLKIIRHASSFERARLEKRLKYHNQMLALAQMPIRRTKRPRTVIFANK
jgi:hypothetical protein